MKSFSVQEILISMNTYKYEAENRKCVFVYKYTFSVFSVRFQKNNIFNLYKMIFQYIFYFHKRNNTLLEKSVLDLIHKCVKQICTAATEI